MTLRVPVRGLAAGERALDAEAAHYVARVHRLRAGAAFVAFDPAACLEADAEVLALRPDVRVSLGEPRPAARVATRSLTVVQALAKGTKIDAIARDATELGATALVVVAAERSVKRAVDLARLERVVLEAARQCGRGDVPALSAHDALAAALTGVVGLGVVLDPGAEESLGAVLARAGDAALALLIGPEGGLSEDELRLARVRGFVPARLGRFVLRTETACAAALGAVAAFTS
jgi:16S rRNA (uracil1498-N3)-methyltransferase